MTQLTLREWVERDGALSVRDAIGWLTRAAKTASKIHEHGHVHGSICADSIVMTEVDCEADGELVHPDDVGLPATYFAPSRDGEADGSSQDDVWALCVTLYYAMTGVLPYPNGVAEWVESGKREAPLIAVHGSDLEVMQLILGEMLKPTITAAQVPTAAILVTQLSTFSPKTAKLPRLKLAMPRAGLVSIPPAPAAPEISEVDVPLEFDIPPLPLLASLPPAPMRKPPPPPPRSAWKARFYVLLIVFALTLAALVVSLLR